MMENYFTLLSPESKEKILALWDNDPRIEAVFLHGSAVRGKMRKDSDLDLALMLAHRSEISGLEKMSMMGELEILFGIRVDLGILSNQNLVYAKEVIWKGERIFDRNPNQTDKKVNLLLSMYYQFKDDAKEVFDVYRIG
jgi:uncharacterized protein